MATKVEELEQEEELPPFIIKLLSALQGKKGLDLSPNTLALNSLTTQYIAYHNCQICYFYVIFGLCMIFNSALCVLMR